MRQALGFFSSLLPQGAFFLAQSHFLLLGDAASMLALAKYVGLLSLVFFLFDGNSGLVHSIARSRFSASELAGSFLAFRFAMLGILALVMFPAVLLDAELPAMAPFLVLALALRLPWLDGPLDQSGRQPLAMALGNAWLVTLAGAALATGGMDGQRAGLAALAGSVILCLVRVILLRADDRANPPWQASHYRPEAFSLIWHYLAVYGCGQIYGRATLFLVGALFTGPLPALLLYAKQVFNAAGLLVNYLRRVEAATRSKAAAFALADVGTSLKAQSILAIPCAVVVVLASIAAPMPVWMTCALLGWQVLERMFSNANYVLQRLDRHGMALTSYAVLAALGSLGLVLGAGLGSVVPFMLVECIAFLVALGAFVAQVWRSPSVALRGPAGLAQ